MAKIKKRRSWRLLLGCSVVIALTAPDSISAESSAVRDVSNRKQFFIDHEFIATSSNVSLAVNSPELAGPALSPGPAGAWDDGMVTWGQVIEDAGIFKMWMGGLSASILKGDWRALDVSEKMGYATSRDGIHWIKPRLGIFDWHGSKENNISSLDPGYVMIDPKGPAAERYKLLCFAAAETGAKDVYESLSPKTGGLFFKVSADGIHWKWIPTQVFPFHPDTANQIDYDPRVGKYVAYIRAWPDGFLAKQTFGRTVARVEMDDPLAPWPYEKGMPPFLPWGKKNIATACKEVPTVISYPNFDDGKVWTDVYNPSVVHYADDVYLAFPSINHYLTNASSANSSTLDIGLVTSRDGIHWEWPSTKPYIPSKRAGEGQMYELTGMLTVGDRIFQYHTATDLGHNINWSKEYTVEQLRSIGRIYRTVQRLDGFISADFPAGGGELTTPPLQFSGRRLQLNLNAKGGAGKVELLDVAGNPIPGYTFEDCHELKSDSVHQTVSWRKGGLRSLAGQTIRIHFRMQMARLYAFQFIN